MFANDAMHKLPSHKQDEINKLKELFVGTLDMEIIESVLINCNYNAHQAKSILHELCGNEKPQQSPQYKSSPNNKKCNIEENTKIKIKNTPNKSAKERYIDDVIDRYNLGYKVFVILRGLPGSGKSFLAKQIVQSCIQDKFQYGNHVFSTDDYFVQNGVYNYNPRRIPEAHAWNQQRVLNHITRNLNPIVIDNTNLCMWEMKPYLEPAVTHRYYIEILEPYTPWCSNVRELSIRNIHNVPKEKIREMAERFEKNITTDKLLYTYNLKSKYHPFKGRPPKKEYITQLCSLSSDRKEVKSTPCDSTYTSARDPIPVSNDLIDLSHIATIKSYTEFNLGAWGVTEDTLHSWDIVKPLADTNKSNETIENNCETKIHKIETKHADTITCNEDFLMLQNPHNDNCKYLITKNRDINRNKTFTNPSPMKKTMLDKSSMTDEESACGLSESEDLKNLLEVFPSIPKTYLNDIYVKCDRNLSWAVELLTENDNIVVVPANCEENEEERICDSNKTVEEETAQVANNTPILKTNKIPYVFQQLKGFIEQKVQINPSHYSKNLIKIKKQRGEIIESDDNLIMFDEVPDLNEATNNLKPCPVENNIATPSTSKIDTYATQSGTVVAMDSDVDISDYSDTEELSVSSNEDNYFELNLGNDTINQLETISDVQIAYPKGFQPIIQIPMSLARQLHALYIESCFQQLEAQNLVLETILKEDEELALKLHMEELQLTEKKETPGLKEIMNEQAAINIYQKEVNQWRKYTPDDLATMLTKQKLTNAFPNVMEDVLMEVYEAHNRNYKETVESLVNSVSCVSSDTNLMDPPISSTVLQDMKSAQEQTPKNLINTEEVHSAEYYRAVANKYLQTRQELFEKAKRHYQQGMFPVAVFYSNLASEQTKLFDQANSLAATRLLASNRNTSNTLDLHHLYVKEALIALDIFLETNSALLENANKSSIFLFIITGRGNNSVNGVARVRPAVFARLKKRKMRFSSVNPGLIRVKLYKKKVH